MISGHLKKATKIFCKLTDMYKGHSINKANLGAKS